MNKQKKNPPSLRSRSSQSDVSLCTSSSAAGSGAPPPNIYPCWIGIQVPLCCTSSFFCLSLLALVLVLTGSFAAASRYSGQFLKTCSPSLHLVAAPPALGCGLILRPCQVVPPPPPPGKAVPGLQLIEPGGELLGASGHCLVWLLLLQIRSPAQRRASFHFFFFFSEISPLDVGEGAEVGLLPAATPGGKVSMQMPKATSVPHPSDFRGPSSTLDSGIYVWTYIL